MYTAYSVPTKKIHFRVIHKHGCCPNAYRVNEYHGGRLTTFAFVWHVRVAQEDIFATTVAVPCKHSYRYANRVTECFLLFLTLAFLLRIKFPQLANMRA